MKTFRQWFETLSQETQQYIAENCSWFDITTEDYYKHKSGSIESIKGVTEYIKGRLEEDRYISDNFVNPAIISCVRMIKDKLTPDEYVHLLYGLDEAVRINKREFDAMDRRELLKLKKKYKDQARKNDRWNASGEYKYNLTDFLLMVEDFDNIDFSLLDHDSLVMDSATVEILGYDEMYRIAKDEPNKFSFRTRGKSNMDNKVFDALFFCEDGWTPEQKKRILNNYGYNEDDAEDFMRRIVAVDESYLKFFCNYFIRNNPALARHLYNQKKTQDELDALPESHRIEDEYRYPKHYRKLFHIAACCARENVGKAMAGTIGDVACMLKMYAYDFNQVFDCMYPELAAESFV